MTEIPTYLFERNTILREGLKSFLADTHFRITGEYNQLAEVSAAPDEAPHLLIIGADRHTFLSIEERRFSEQVDRLRALLSQPRIVIMMPQEDLACAPALFRCHADSYIPNDLSPAALTSYLNLAMIGEKVIPAPAAMMMAANEDRHHNDAMPPLAKEHYLSERESDIIECLMRGQSNKLIAKHLHITESTVKVHLKTILRKLGVSNRTQAAMWAVRNGFGRQPPQHELLSVA